MMFQKISRFLFILIVFSLASYYSAKGQIDSVKHLNNTIKVNVSNPMIFGWKFNVIGYERIIKDHQSASITMGRIAFPKFEEIADSMGIAKQGNDNGFNLSLEYRFYFRKENKYRAPRGVFIGPYYAFNKFSRDITWDINKESYTGIVNSDINLTAHLVGAQLGYQFVLWNRLAIDLILMGPGWWSFGLKTNFDTNLSAEDEQALLEKLNQMLQDKFPGSDLVIQGDGFSAKRSDWTSTAGFRYMINLGFRF